MSEDRGPEKYSCSEKERNPEAEVCLAPCFVVPAPFSGLSILGASALLIQASL